MSEGDMFRIGLDTSGLDRDKVEVINVFDSIADEAMKSGQAMDEAIVGSVREISTSLGEVDASALSERLQEHINKGVETLGQLEDEISAIDGQLKTSFDSEQIENLISKKEELREKAQTLSEQIGQLSTMQQQLSDTTEQSSDSTESMADSMKGVLDGMNPLNDVIGNLPAPLQNVVHGLQGMTGAAKKFIAVPIIAVITAIAVALMALTSWFRNSQEGQLAFAKASGYVSGVLGQLKEIVLAVGRALYEAFTNPQEAVRKLWDTIKKNIVNRFEGLGEMFKAMGKIIASGFRDGYDELNNAFLKTTTGVDDLIGKTQSYINGVKESAKKTQELKVAEFQLHEERSKWQQKEAELDEKISEARNKMYLGSNDDRMKAALEVEELTNEKYAKRIEFANEEYRIKKEMNALTTNAQADYDEERRLQAEITKLSAQRNSELRMTMRMKGSMEKMTSGTSPEQQEALRLQQEYESTILSLRQSVEQQRYNLTKEGIEDRQQLIDAEYQYEMELIRKNKEAFINKFGSDADTSLFDELFGLSDDKYQKKTQDLFEEILADYKTFEEKRTEITEKFATDRLALEAKNKDGKYDANIEELNKKEKEELAKFDTQVQSKTSIMARMFSDMSLKSIEELKAIRDEAEALWAFLSKGEWNAEQGKLFGITKEQFESIIADPTKLAQFKKGVDGIKEAILALDTPLEKIKEGIKELFDSDNNDTKKQQEGVQKVTEGYNQYAKAVTFVADAFRDLAELADSDFLSRLADGLSDVVSIGSETMSGAMMGAQIGGKAGAIVGGVIGLVKGVVGVLAKNKKAREEQKKQIEENQKLEYFGQLDIEALYRSKYEWTKKIGETTLNYLSREGEELKKQAEANEKAQAELWSKLRNEQYKSGEHFEKTGLFGWGKGKIVEEWSSLAGKSWEQIEALAAQGKLSEEGKEFYEALKKAKEEGANIEDMQEQYLEKMKEVYTGTSYESLVSGIVDAFKQGKRSASDFAKSFEELLKGAVASSLELLADEKMRAWYEKYADYAKDGLTAEEIDELRRTYIALNENLAKQAQDMEAITGVSLSQQSQEGATYGMYEKITESQANSIDGRLTGIHQETLLHTTLLTNVSNNMQEVRDVALEGLAEIILIRKYTSLLNETNSKLDKVVSNTDRL